MSKSHYQRCFERLEAEVIDMAGGQITQSKPAVLAYPEDAEITGPELEETIEELEDMYPVSPFLEEPNDDDSSFYYTSGRLYRTEGTPDLSIKADNTTLRIFENPYEAKEPLPRIEFETFKEIVQSIEDSLGVTFQEADVDD